MSEVPQNLWDVSVGEELLCKKDSGKEKDPYAVAVAGAHEPPKAAKERVTCEYP